MDKLESLKKEEEKFTKNKRISFLVWQIFFVSVLIIPQFFDVPPFVSVSFIIGFIVSCIVLWISHRKVEKIKKEIAGTKKE